MAKNQRLVSGVVCKHSVLGFRGRMWAQLVALLGVGGSTILFSTIRSNVGIIQREFDLPGSLGFFFVLNIHRNELSMMQASQSCASCSSLYSCKRRRVPPTPWYGMNAQQFNY